MDLTIPMVFVFIFIVACLSLVFVYKYGMKEKSYEEALAEQRQQTQALLGTKPKPKEKKPKKPSKKVCKNHKYLNFFVIILDWEIPKKHLKLFILIFLLSAVLSLSANQTCNELKINLLFKMKFHL